MSAAKPGPGSGTACLERAGESQHCELKRVPNPPRSGALVGCQALRPPSGQAFAGWSPGRPHCEPDPRSDMPAANGCAGNARPRSGAAAHAPAHHGLPLADIAFGYDLRKRQTIAAVVRRDFGSETQMAGDDLVRSLAIAVLPPAFGKPVLQFLLEHRETSNVTQIA